MAPVTGKGKAVRGNVDEAEIAFEGVAPGLGMELAATASGVKEDLVLANADAPTKYDFTLGLQGLSAVEAGGGVHFLDKADQVVAAVPAGFMVDAAGELSEDVVMKLTGPKDAPVLRVEVDEKWLTDPARVFPVQVDPTVQLDTGLDDSFVESARPTTNFAGYSFFRIGLNPNGAVSRSYLKFNTSALNGKTIDYADLVLWNQTSLSCTPYDVSVYRVSQDWTGSTINWPGPARQERVGLVTG